MKLTLEQIIEAMQATDEQGNLLPADARRTKVGELFTEHEVDRDGVDALTNEALEQFQSLNAVDNPTDDQLLGLELLVDVMNVGAETRSAFDQADADRAARREALAAEAAKVAGTQEPAADKDKGAEAKDTGDPAVVADKDKPVDNEGGDTAVADTAAAETAETEPQGDLVTASGRKAGSKFSIGDVPKRTPAEVIPAAEEPKTGGVKIITASGVRGHDTGSELAGIKELAAAATSVVRGLPTKGIKGRTKADIASLAIQFPDELVASGRVDDGEVMNRAVDESRLPGGSITAAGGWCAPSETLYDIPGSLTDATAGMLDLPEVQMRRGGLKFRRQVDFGAIYSGGMAGRVMTEAMAESADEADYTKVFYRVDCPDEFDEVRADAVYTGATAGILQNHAYPEEVEAQISELIAAHAHRVNAITLQRAETLFAALNQVNLSTNFGPSSVGGQLNAIGWLITNERYRYRAGDSLRMNVVLPEWDRETLKADYALRHGIPDALDVDDAQIDAWFAKRNAKLQWVYDWQDALVNGGTGVGQAATMTSYPTSVKALVYPDGTLVRGRGDVINLEAIYDSVGLQTNDFLRLFMEESLAVAHRAYRGSVATLPVAVNGATGAARNLDGNGKIVADVTP